MLTLSDYTQITRYFLESYSGDVLRQLNMGANNPDSEMFKLFREAKSGKKINNSFYKSTAMLEDLAAELKVEILPIEVKFSKVEEIGYPEAFYCPNDLKGAEKRGILEIQCKAKFRGRNYNLEVQYPFTVVMRMVPVLKDFMLYADKAANEQGDKKIGTRDLLNVMYTEDGSHPEKIDKSVTKVMPDRMDNNVKYRPWVLMAPPDPVEFNDKALSGKVYLGPSRESIFLNLTGDNNPGERFSLGELFLVSPSSFNVAAKDPSLVQIQGFPRKDGTYVNMVGMEVPLQNNHSANMGVMGFSKEMIPEFGIFANSNYSIEDFLGKTSDNTGFWKVLHDEGLGFAAFASGIKLMGIKVPKRGPPAREVFGNIFSRFFIITFWHYPSAAGGKGYLTYDENRDDKDFPEGDTYSGMIKKHFRPLDPNANYKDFMSRMVSGKKWSPGTTIPYGFLPYNFDWNVSAENKPRRLFERKDFVANDGFKVNDALDKLGDAWFGVNEHSSTLGIKSKGVEPRIGRSFSSGKEFIDASGYKNGFFNVNGVVYVGGNLTLDDLDMTNDKIKGGIILVDGTITLKNITRGYNIDNSRLKYEEYDQIEKYYSQFKKEITQDNFLTFVSLKGYPINVEGETLIGVHLINLNDDQGRPYSQIRWKSRKKKEILFCGGISCNYLNLPQTLRDFGEIKSPGEIMKAPFFIYHSAMAADKPSFAVQVMEDMRGYNLTAEKAPRE